MARKKHKAATAAAAWLFVAVMFASAVTNGVCLCGKFAADGGKGGVCLVSVDVCGTGPASVVQQGVNTLALAGFSAGFYYPSISLIPPAPEQAVASAEPGETEKPPEA